MYCLVERGSCLSFHHTSDLHLILPLQVWLRVVQQTVLPEEQGQRAWWALAC